MEDLALDRTALEHPPFGCLQLIEARGEQGLQRGRDEYLTVRLAGHGQHLFDEERVATGRLSDPLPQPAGDVSGNELLNLLLAQRLEPQRHWPSRMVLYELRAGNAEQEERRTRGEEPDVLDKVEEGLLCPLDVVEDDHESPLRGVFQRLAEGPSDLFSRGGCLCLAEKRADRRR